MLSIIADLYSANQQKKAAKGAANAQVRAAELGIEEQRRQFDAIQELLKPYISAGTGALTEQQGLLGLGGQDAQSAAINAITGGPEYQAMVQQGETGILQSASATGGLRGGNIQSALSQFRPALLSDMINRRFQNLDVLSSRGQASAVGQAGYGSAMASNVSNLLGEQGAARAGGLLARGQINANTATGIAGNVQGTLLSLLPF